MLEETIRSSPLTIANVHRFMEQHLEKIVLNAPLLSVGELQTIPKNSKEYKKQPWNWNQQFRFNILFLDVHNEGPGITTIHEISHALYGYHEEQDLLKGVPKEETERIIETEAKRFYETNKSQVDALIEPRYEAWKSTQTLYCRTPT